MTVRAARRLPYLMMYLTPRVPLEICRRFEPRFTIAYRFRKDRRRISPGGESTGCCRLALAANSL
jgi:hypothetical protein